MHESILNLKTYRVLVMYLSECVMNGIYEVDSSSIEICDLFFASSKKRIEVGLSEKERSEKYFLQTFFFPFP